MRSSRYFVFECYARGVFVFRSYGIAAARRNPIPVSNGDFRKLQRKFNLDGTSLAYNFVASGLLKEAAQRLVLQLDEGEPNVGETENRSTLPQCKPDQVTRGERVSRDDSAEPPL